MPDTGFDGHEPQGVCPKFADPLQTATGEPRAYVSPRPLRTLWFQTGSLCNIACVNCYMESSPRNDQLAYLSAEEIETYLDEIARLAWPVEEVGFTGGEPFLNRDLVRMLANVLGRGYQAVVLTNAMKPLHQKRGELLELLRVFGDALTLRVSMDHYRPEFHERLRGAGSWAPMIEGVRWLAHHRFRLHVAGRTVWNEPEAALRQGFAALFAAEGIDVDAFDPLALVLFPEMDPLHEVPEITVRCWSLLGVSPDDMMCASSRMVIKRKGACRPVVVPCTLLPYDPRFELGSTLEEAARPVALNHPYCAQFCVLGGASCSTR